MKRPPRPPQAKGKRPQAPFAKGGCPPPAEGGGIPLFEQHFFEERADNIRPYIKSLI